MICFGGVSLPCSATINLGKMSDWLTGITETFSHSHGAWCMVHGARHSVDLYGADIYVDWNLSAIICNPEAFSNLCSAVCIAARMKAKNVETYSKDLCRKQPATNAIILIFCRDCE